MFIDELEKINSFYTMINKEIARRKTLFADYMGSYTNYIKTSGKTLPNIICIIHQFETIYDQQVQIAEKFYNLFKEGPKFGITFIVTNSLATGIRMKMLQFFPNKISLKLNEQADYKMTVDAPKTLVPANYFG